MKKHIRFSQSTLTPCRILLLGVLSALPVAAFAQVPSALDDTFNIADPSAPEINPSNFLESEEFWPYRLQYIAESTESKRGNLPSSESVGVLLFVSAEGHSVIADFGRDGIFTLPRQATDLIERANRNRLVPQAKKAPNFVLRYGNKLVDGASPTLSPYRYPPGAEYAGWVFFLADPNSPEFAQMAKAFNHLSPDESAVMPVFVPVGSMEDQQVLDQLQEQDWSVPFIYKFLAAAYRPSFQINGLVPPAVVIASPEGRLYYAEKWSSENVPAITALLKELPSEPADVAAALKRPE